MSLTIITITENNKEAMYFQYSPPIVFVFRQVRAKKTSGAYAAPEAIATFRREEIPRRAKLEPSLDNNSFGVMIPQVLFMEEEPRFDGKVCVVVAVRVSAGCICPPFFVALVPVHMSPSICLTVSMIWPLCLRGNSCVCVCLELTSYFKALRVTLQAPPFNQEKHSVRRPLPSLTHSLINSAVPSPRRMPHHEHKQPIQIISTHS